MGDLGKSHELELGRWRVKARRAGAFGLVLDGLVDQGPDEDWLHAILQEPSDREAMFSLVDREGLIVCKDVRSTHPSYRDVRGRSSRGRLSQGEYYHHDGCSSEAPPRIVEIRYPHQQTPRHTRTAIAPFPATVIAMLEVLPTRLAAHPDAARARARIAEGSLAQGDWDLAQGVLTRLVRRELDSSDARVYFDVVDGSVGAYREPWTPGESRLIANANPVRTMQHRRAYLQAPDGRANGHLVKRWPAEELDAPEASYPRGPAGQACTESGAFQELDGLG
ncbi:MAG: hypothetical protein IAG13_13170 [Deltaproteobacteria bacterium]|nr:hypothetical protein [Nannocystaceae bacterium]